MYENFNFLSEMSKILEFLLLLYPSDFYKTSTLCFSRLSNFLKNISSRILDKSFSLKFIEITEMFKPGKSIEVFSRICHPIIGIIINVHNKLDQNTEMLKRLFIDSDLDVSSLFNVLSYIKKENFDNPIINKYKLIVESYISAKGKNYSKTMSDKEWKELEANDKICIICYSNEINTILVPCGHRKFLLKQIPVMNVSDSI
jgi:hypothetical protein